MRRVVPENGRSGGYALLSLPGTTRFAMLHCTQMTPEVRADLNEGGLDVGELLYVEVTEVNGQGKVWVRDLGDPAVRDEAA